MGLFFTLIKNIIIRWINMNKPKNIIILDNMPRKYNIKNLGIENKLNINRKNDWKRYFWCCLLGKIV